MKNNPFGNAGAPRRGGILPRTSAVAVVAAAMFACGCVSVSLSGNGGPPVPKKSTYLNSSSARIRTLDPVVKRTDASTAKISFALVGDFEYVDTVTTSTSRPEDHRLAIGFFPGAAKAPKPAARAATAFRAVWYNICFFGTPTLAGIFVAPFVERPEDGDSAFSQSALFGFHKWFIRAYWAPTHSENHSRHEKRIPLEGVRCTAGGYLHEPKEEEGAVVVRGLPAGRQKVPVKITVPDGHPLKSKLRLYERGQIPVEIPEEAKP